MNIRIERRGLNLDGTRYPCTVRQRMSGGNLRVDRQFERGAEEPTSKVTWEWDGWNPRQLTLIVEVSSSLPSGGADIRAALSAHLHSGARDGATPVPHDLGGTMLRAAGATGTQWVMMGDPDWDDDGVTNELTLTVIFDEFDPEIASLRQKPIPQPEAPEDDPDPVDNLDDAARSRAAALNESLLEAQQLGPGF